MRIHSAQRRFARNGFTLIELLVSLSIFAVVTAFAMANFRVGQQGDELRLAARTTASLIRRAQTQTVSGYMVKYCDGGSTNGAICATDMDCGSGSCFSRIPPAYGINISAVSGENREVRVFADTNANGSYDQGEAIRFDSVSAGPFVRIDSVSPADGNELDIVYNPPKPTVKFNGSMAEGTATVILRHDSTGDTMTITINRISGLISVD